MLESQAATDLDAVREATERELVEACDADSPVLLEAPPSSGKTTSAYMLSKKMDTPITYLSAREDLYRDAKEWCQNQSEIEWEVIPSPHRDCPTFRGDNDGDSGKVRHLYDKGFSGHEIHYLDRDTAYTPCVAGEDSCEYLQKLERTTNELDEINFLIGHHKHAYSTQYVEDRIVILDEFNPQPFVRGFPSDADVTDDPGEIVSHFLGLLDEEDEDFPTDELADVTDLVTKRTDESVLKDAIDWFEENGVGRREVSKLEFFEPSTYQYDSTHLQAPYLTLSLLCMRKVGDGIELAPPPENETGRAHWERAGVNPGWKCLRNRNTGEMYSLRTTDLSAASQVIGLDGLPCVPLWNLVFGVEDEFDHRQIVSRDDFTDYLGGAMNMSIVQVGDGMHNYAGGRVSPKDKDRLLAVYLKEDEKPAVVSTKRAIEHYKRDSDISQLINLDKARHYGTVLSSNEFKKESLGVVAGTPYPGDHVIKRWAGFAGESVEVVGKGTDRDFGEFGNRIFRYFTHYQVVQAILRFGRDQSVWKNGGSRVYVITKALPDWFEIDEKIRVRNFPKESKVVEYLREAGISAEKKPLEWQTASSLAEFISESDETSVTATYVRNVLEELRSRGVVDVRERAGSGGADQYRWDGEDRILHPLSQVRVLVLEDRLYVLE